ncbi:hypothetical protein BDV30DRAFT_134738 [Aspergillus minisclerotigenes]|uniref:DUF1749-domain-containing protein n=1 Tax=Aspergillus minisclerotigenes TaxID=656917 RepID=A0A5N6J196_9EURO|nr:hypothetical protein BDV30DRAFT_134738 [Aspergillus minisclerotigenes]
MSQSHSGILHEYAPRLTAFEFNPGPKKQHSLLFVGGLTDGLLTVPYVSALAKAFESTEWTVFNVLLSSSYLGWGVESLDKDVTELAQCVNFVRGLKPQGKVVLMGHSTGSQDVLHYLHSPNPLPGQENSRPVLDGAIMQAPVSDREHILHLAHSNQEVRGAYEQLVNFARLQAPQSLLPLNLTAVVGWPDNTGISCRRFLSLASPESPEKPAEDDLFSSDLKDQRLKETFGAIAERGLVKGRLAALYSGNDEYALPSVDKEALLRRWKEATNAGGVEKWSEYSGVIPGATHNVKDEGQDWLVERVLQYLNSV